MKSICIVRRLDELGRVVIPAAVRRVMNITNRDSLEIFIDGETIVMRKYVPGCIKCGDLNIISDDNQIKLCQHCLDKPVNHSIALK